MIDYAVQRANMIDSQIRPNGITDARVIAAMTEIPREDFVADQGEAAAVAAEADELASGPLQGDEVGGAAATEVVPLPAAAVVGALVEQGRGLLDAVVEPVQVGQGDVAVVEAPLSLLQGRVLVVERLLRLVAGDPLLFVGRGGAPR